MSDCDISLLNAIIIYFNYLKKQTRLFFFFLFFFLKSLLLTSVYKQMRMMAEKPDRAAGFPDPKMLKEAEAKLQGVVMFLNKTQI